MSNNINININKRKRCRNNRTTTDRFTDRSDVEGTDNVLSPEREDNLVDELRNFIGKTVTIFTTSGGESGEGFTGVLIRVNNTFVTLITQIGQGPSCALGNTCDMEEVTGTGTRSSSTTDRRRVVRNLGAETDIPLNRIAAFVHNAI